MKFLQVALLCALAVIVTHAEIEPTPEDFELEIPEDCIKIGICQDVPNYPQDLADKAIAQLKKISALKQDLPVLSDIAERVGPHEENIELCKSEKRVYYPRAAIDSNGKWHVVLNQDNNPVQGFVVEICAPMSAPCSNLITTQNGYQTSCKQKFIYSTMEVLRRNGTISQMPLQVPSSCSCLAHVL